jgi:hypothetical protein
MKVRNHFNYMKNKLPSPETANLPSRAVPDMTLPISELIRRQKAGQQITELTGIYQEDGNYNELLAAINGMSEMDRLDYARELADETREGLKKYKKTVEENRKKMENAKIKAMEDKIAASNAALELLRNPIKEEKTSKKPS